MKLWLLSSWLLRYCCLFSTLHRVTIFCRAFAPLRQTKRRSFYRYHDIPSLSVRVPYSSFVSLQSRRHVLRTSSLDDENAQETDKEANARASHKQEDSVLTSILFQVSYDGSRFSGWSAGNFQVNPRTKRNHNTTTTHAPRSSPRRRNRHLYSLGTTTQQGSVRTVQGVLQLALAKVYGNIKPTYIVVEGASRTDKGVHAVGMVAHVYGLTTMTTANMTANVTPSLSTIPGKRFPHPHFGTDTAGFRPLPMPPDRLAFTLNRMLPADVRITAYATLPRTSRRRDIFHASQSATSKTYVYHLSTGPRADPTRARTTWYIGPAETLDWNSNAVQETIHLLTAQAYSFQALSATPKGRDDKQKRAKSLLRTCRLYQIDVEPQDAMNHAWEQPQHNGDDTATMTWGSDNTGNNQELDHVYTITVSGDRFLYKMMRLLVGLLVSVARGQISPAQVQTMLTTGRRDNDVSVVCAPAHGLVLQKVHYDDDEDLEWHLATS